MGLGGFVPFYHGRFKFTNIAFTVHPDSDFECMGLLAEHTQDVKCVAWHPTEEILASASYDDSIKLYIDDPSEDWFCFTTLSGHTSTVWSICFAPSGNYLASASDDSTVRIWKQVSEHRWECVSVLEGHERSVYSVSWGTGKSAVDGGLGWVASTGSDGRINIWELSVRLRPFCNELAEHALLLCLSNRNHRPR